MVEFDHFKNEEGRHAFTMSPQKWIRETKSIGLKTLLMDKNENNQYYLKYSEKEIKEIFK